MVWMIGGLTLFVAFGVIMGKKILEPLGFRPKAVVGTATVSIKPSTQSLPPDQTFQVWVVTDNPVGFAQVVLNFDPTKIKLKEEISMTDSPFIIKNIEPTPPTGTVTNLVKKTSMTEANTSGNISLIIGLHPDQKASPPIGAFQLASLVFTPATTATTTTVVQIPAASVQLVDLNAAVFTVQTESSTLSLNPPNTPTPTPTGTPTPTRTPTPTPLPTTIPPTGVPTSTPTPTPTRTPTPTPTRTPTPTPVPPTATPTPRPTNTPTPTPTRTPTPRPTNTPTPTPTRTPTPTPRPTSTPIPTPTPTPTIPGTSDEVITVLSAKIRPIFWIYKILEIKATDNLAPNAILTATNYGRLYYSSYSRTYTGRFYTRTTPSSIIITSSRGGVITAPVTR